MQFLRLRISAPAIAVALLLIGCASSTRIVNEWVDPEYRSPHFNRILVVGVSKQPSLRRTFANVIDALKSKNLLPSR